MKLALYYKKDNATIEYVNRFKEICPFELIDLTADSLDNKADYVLSFGGDGTTLKCIDLLLKRKFKEPIIAINTGNLGFLSAYTPNNLQDIIQDLQNNDIIFDNKLLLQCKIGKKSYYALNEIVIERARGKRCEANTFAYTINNEITQEIKSDGVLVATPTGSTAYSLSAGGSVLHPQLKAFIVTPICAHSTTCGAIVIPQNKKVQISVLKCSEPCLIYCDGRLISTIVCNQGITVNKAKVSVKLARGKNFFTTFK